jgi:voltage-gated potassium channel
MGCYSASSDLQINPKADDIIHLEDKLLVFGTDAEIKQLKTIGKAKKEDRG